MTKEFVQLISTAQVATPVNEHSGYIAFSRIDTNRIYGRLAPIDGSPENNSIFTAVLHATVHGTYMLRDITPVLNPSNDQADPDGPTIGLEDPTAMAPNHNLFHPDVDGMLATDVHRNGRISTKVVYCEGNTILHSVISPHDPHIQKMDPHTTMIKEAELLPYGPRGKISVLFENCGKHSQLALGVVRDGKVVDTNLFYTVDDDQSDQLSTAGQPTLLDNGSLLLFFNRRRKNARNQLEWGITYMHIDPDTLKRRYVHPYFLITAPSDAGDGPGGQRIAFASCITPTSNQNVEVLYHVNDRTPYRAEVAIAA